MPQRSEISRERLGVAQRREGTEELQIAGVERWLGRRQRAQEIPEIVSKRMKLETDGVGGEGTARQPRPFDCALALFDPLLARAALIVEGDDILGRPRHVRDDKADARIEFARTPFDLGDDAARFRPASCLIIEVRIGTPYLVRRPPQGTRQQVSDPFFEFGHTRFAQNRMRYEYL